LKKWLPAIAFSVLLLVPIGAQNVLAATVTLNEDAVMTVGSGSTVTIDTDDSSTLDNQGNINIEENGIINIGSKASSQTLLINGGTINGPGIINLFGIDIDILNNGVITAIINKIFSSGPEPPTVVGGEIIPIESTAVLLAAAYMTTSWLVPVVVASIGIGIVMARRF